MAKGKAIAINDNNEWRVKEDLRTLLEAAKIQNDPKRMKLVQQLVKKQQVDAKKAGIFNKVQSGVMGAG